MSDMLTTYVEAITSAYAGNVKSIILYGSKASGEDTLKHSDYNILIVLNELVFDDLKGLTKATAKWVKQGNPPPLIFTDTRLKKSADVFPIEFLDMKNNRRVLYGEDPFTQLEIKDTHLRHECEFELKGKLLKLRQGYLMVADKPSKIRELLINSLSTFLILFKHTVKLLGGEPPKKKLDALDILKDKAGLHPEIFITVYQMKQGDKQALKSDAERCMQEYIEEVEKIVDVVDNLGDTA